MRKLRWGPAAFILSAIALFVALGGTGLAANQPAAPAPAAQTALAATTLPAWHNLTLTGGWVYGGFSSYHAGYYKDSQHVVHLRGSAMSGSTSSAAFTLSSGNRPAHTLWLPIYAFAGSAGGLEIKSDGNAYFFDAVSGVNVTGYSSLDGISFRVP